MREGEFKLLVATAAYAMSREEFEAVVTRELQELHASIMREYDTQRDIADIRGLADAAG